MVADLFIVYPTDGKVNGIRSNYPYGEADNATTITTNGSKRGSCTYPGYTGTVFEPIDTYKGDFARAYFYVATRYKNVLSNWGGESFSGDNLSTWTKNMLLAWHELDPVSSKETNRNDAAYNVQHNRNPFVDHPEWVQCVWGTSCSALKFTSTPVSQIEEAQVYTYNIAFESDDTGVTLDLSVETALPGWLTFSQTSKATTGTGTLTGTPGFSDIGTYDFTLSLTDGTNTTKQNFTITVTPKGLVNVFTKNFDDNSITSGGWTAYSVSGTLVWVIAPYFNSEPYCAKMSGWDGSSNANEDWFISPSFNADAYELETFSFWSALNYTGTTPTVKYSTNYTSGAPATATWTALTGFHLPPSTDWSFEYSENIDLSLIAGTNVHLAFVYVSTSTASNTWELDDIKLDAVTKSSAVYDIGKNDNILIFPNPLSDVLNIRFDEHNTDSDFNTEITDITGKLLFSGHYAADNQNIQIPTSGLPKGILFLKISNQNYSITKKIIKL
jgi:hypothetical protein